MRSRDRANPLERHRCAIYTRKSSEEGLEQEFNSLDAQREACEAYIKSQKAAGWAAIPAMYDDGGYSGGSMDRPALRRLLVDIEAGLIDTVVVYKVDRLTRSLADFAKIVDAFDARNVSFVSVTQQFNTTSSMGRLTLNMLLSFAQFEREVTGERIRDKIAASKRKGMWMGGMTPLGYDIKDRKLVVNDREADTVCHIFRRYAALKSVRALKEELDAAGIVSKVRAGQRPGGVPLAPGALYAMLQSRIYRGEIVHNDNVYPGLHDAIIDEALWNDVQQTLHENRVERTTGSAATDPSLLAGLVYDGGGQPMSPTHANKKGVRYRYYVSQSLIKRRHPGASDTACRVPAADLEALVEDRIRILLKNKAIILDSAGSAPLSTRKALTERSADLEHRWPALSASLRRAILHALVARIDVRPNTVEISICIGVLADVTNPALDVRKLPTHPTGSIEVLTVPACVRRTGMETKLLIDGAPLGHREPDRSLLRLLGQARRYNEMIVQNADVSISDLAAMAGVTQSYFTRVFRLSFLAPEITAAILQGSQPPQLTANKLKQVHALSTRWPDQHRQLGFK
jgi:DNA invertase Pin-like site-specific DNA recombinase